MSWRQGCRTRRAAAAWCERIGALAPELRDGRTWHYALVGEALFFEWRDQGARLADLLDYARIRPAASREAQVTFDFGAGDG